MMRRPKMMAKEKREKVRARNAKYRIENPEKVRTIAAKYQREHPEKARARGVRYHRANPEKAHARTTMKWRKENPEKVRAANAKWALEHAEERTKKARVRVAKWARAHPEKARAATLKWQRENRETMNVIARRRRARKASALGTHTAADVKRQLISQGRMCFYCSVPLQKYHVEHKTPLCRGGSNGAENIVCACPTCNLRKGKKTAEEFIAILRKLTAA